MSQTLFWTRARLGLVLLVSLAAWIYFKTQSHALLEDALITFKYSQNLVLGNGFVYNIGERVLGTTTPLATLLFAAGGLIFGVGNIPLAATALLFAFGLGTVYLTYQILKELGVDRGRSAEWLSLFGAFAVGLNPSTVSVIVGGMETSLVLFFMAASLLALLREHYGWFGILNALLILTRIDGGVWVVVLVFGCLLINRSGAFKAIALTLVTLAPWIIFSWIYFGSPIPNTLAAKSVIHFQHEHFSRSTLHFYRSWALDGVGALTPGLTYLGLLLYVLGFLFLRSNSQNERRRTIGFAFASFPLVFILIYFLADPPIFDWYIVPVQWASILVGVCGIVYLVGRLSYLRRGFGGSPTIRLALVFASLILYAALLVNRNEDSLELYSAVQKNEDGLRKVVGEWLKASTPKNARVAMEAIGYQGYYADRNVIDLAGLVSPEVVRIFKTSTPPAKAFRTTLDELKPDYLVLRSFEYEENKLWYGGAMFRDSNDKAYFDTRYIAVKQFEAPLTGLWGKGSYETVFRRVDE